MMANKSLSSPLCITCKARKLRSNLCYVCNRAKELFIPSGNKVIDDFISYTLTNSTKKYGNMIFVPYDNFKNIEFIGEGGFSKIYKATWIDCKISNDTLNYSLRNKFETVALKKLNNSKNITSKELNELKVFYHYSLNRKNSYDSYVNVYYGITQDPTTQDLIFIMPYYDSDLTYCITKYFFKINWHGKMSYLQSIISGLVNIHDANIIHRDLHSGNILVDNIHVKICDLGTSKSATENDDNNNIYGIIPYVAPECWHPDPEIRPTAVEVSKVIHDIRYNGNALQTKIIKSSDVGPATIHNPGAIYKSRYLSNMIKSAATTRSLRSQSITSKDQLNFYQRNSNNKRKFEDNNQSENNFDDGDSIKKTKLTEDENNDYVTKEIKFDIDTNSKQPNDEKYITREIGFDI
ncbi:uncharacterized protein OCT59_006674 [Rhizophagus irregularis]|uniref:uncharacterized protein n=1 Tax=Rhizophagus irregularis TaxID=588596 RepID=UPI00331F1FAB|nr:hypothetical protein OCT59_006674 [Rhizophagus irregularis]